MTPPARRRWPILAAVLLLLAVEAVLALAPRPAHLERDVAQDRLDVAGALIGPTSTLGQTITVRRNGLRRVEFLAVVPDPARLAPEGQLCLDLARLDAPAAAPVSGCLPTAGIAHNQVLTFDLPPQPASRGAIYLMTLRGDVDLGVSVWRTDHEAYSGGQAYEDGAPRDGDLYFRTYCDYRPADALADLAAGLGRRAWPIAVAAVMLLVPGAALLRWIPIGRRLDPVVALTLAASLSLAYWPLALAWITPTGLRLGPAGAWWVVALPAVAIAVRCVLRRGSSSCISSPFPPSLVPSVTRDDDSRDAQAPLSPRYHSIMHAIGSWRVGSCRTRDPWPDVALAVIMILVVATRALQVRDLVLPAWVDSVHHTMIARLIADAGRVPVSYRPYMPIDGFHYHFGFHAGAAALSWLSGLVITEAVLLYGQALNVLAPLAAYTLASGLGRNRWGGVAAALVVGALCYMPAYYVTWGRYTQLAGLDMLPALALATAWALEGKWVRGSGACALRESTSPAALGTGDREDASRHVGASPRGASSLAALGEPWCPILLAALLLAGLVLTHYRVLVFYVLLALPQAGLALWRVIGRSGSDRTHPRGDALRGIIGRGALCAGLAVLLALPWVLGFLERVGTTFGEAYGGWSAGEGGNAFPVALLTVGWTRPLLIVAGVGALWGLVRRRGEVLVIALWVGLCLLAANPRLLGIADTWMITNSSVVIAFWLPLGALVGWLVGDLAGLLARLRVPWAHTAGRPFVSAALLVATVAVAGVGSWRLVDIVNPVTVLAEEDDLAAIAWARENTPPDALFLVNTGVWQGPMRYGTDAGWWLNILADRRTTFSSLLYITGGAAHHSAVNALAIAVEETASPDDPALLARLRAAGVTHIYVGARGGHLLPKDLDPSPNYRTLYARGPTRIYEVVYPPDTDA